MNTEKKFTEEIDIKKPQTARKKPKFLWVFLVVLSILISSTFGAVFGFMAGGISQKIFPNIFGKYLNSLSFNQGKTPDIIKQQVVEEDSAITNVVQDDSPAVVSIVISKDVSKMQDFFSNPFNFPDFFGNGGDIFGNPAPSPAPQNNGGSGTEKQTIGGGSGFIITSDGMIVTNKHVVSDATADYTVITSDGKEHQAKILAADPVNDIAVIRIDGNNFPTLNLGDSDSLKIGQTVIAIGNSLGEFSNTVSKGIVSGLKRSVTASGGFGESETLSNIIQTDAAINPGNSGGPLIDINGNVIGINVAMAQGAQNIGFAIPASQIKKVVDQVKTTGKITAPYLGVRYISIDSQVKQNITNFSYDYGVLVVRGSAVTDFAVIPGSPADKAGIVENDVILEIGGTKLDQNNSLSDLIAKHNVGDVIDLKIWHKGEVKDVSVTLGER